MSGSSNKPFSLPPSLICFVLYAALAALVLGLRASRAASGQAPTDTLHVPELDAGFRLLYQLKPVEARAQFEAWQKSHPEGALGYASEAAASVEPSTAKRLALSALAAGHS
jgi:hypothetical protein